MKISHKIMQYLKKRAMAMGITQTTIAKKFKVSLPTVKRWYSSGNVDVDRLADLCGFLGISLAEAISQVEDSKKYFSYSLEQERFFSKNPDFLAFFDNLIRGNTVEAIKKKFSLPTTQVDKYLLKLDKLGLIELYPKNKVKLLVDGEPVWTPEGPLHKHFLSEIFASFLQTKTAVQDRFMLHDLRKDDLELIKQKIDEVVSVSSRAHKRSSLAPEESHSYGLYIALKPFRWTLDGYLK